MRWRTPPRESDRCRSRQPRPSTRCGGRRRRRKAGRSTGRRPGTGGAFVAARDELATTWLEAEQAHPVLAAFRRGPAREERSGLRLREARPRRARQQRRRKGDRDAVDARPPHPRAHRPREGAHLQGPSHPSPLPSVVALTQANMFIPAGSIRAGVVRDRVQAARDDRESWLVSALSLALALVTLVPTGGASLAMVGVASATLATYSTLRELEQFELHKVLADTDLDRARALMQGDPSLARFVTSLSRSASRGCRSCMRSPPPGSCAWRCGRATTRRGSSADQRRHGRGEARRAGARGRTGGRAPRGACRRRAAAEGAARADGPRAWPRCPAAAGPGAVHGLSGPARGCRRDAERAARPDRDRHAPADPLRDGRGRPAQGLALHRAGAREGDARRRRTRGPGAAADRPDVTARSRPLRRGDRGRLGARAACERLDPRRARRDGEGDWARWR